MKKYIFIIFDRYHGASSKVTKFEFDGTASKSWNYIIKQQASDDEEFEEMNYQKGYKKGNVICYDQEEVSYLLIAG